MSVKLSIVSRAPVFKPLFVCLLAVSVSVSACTSIPVSSLYTLSRIDFMTTDLDRLRIAITLPAAIKPRKTGVQMETKRQFGDAPERTDVIVLEAASEPADMVGLPTDLATGTKIYVYRLPKGEIAKLETIRGEGQRNKAAGKKGTFGMGIAAKEFCKMGPLDAGPIYTTTYLASSETGGYVVLTQDMNLRSDTTISASLDHLSPCSD
jgi:hypothetical protein